MAVDNIARAMASRSGGGGSGGAVSSVNGQTGNVVLSYADVDALPNTTTIPTKTSQLSNDNGFVVDKNYIHTDENYTTQDKNKVDNIPTKISQLQNDEGFIKNDVNNLQNYYDKTVVDNKADKTEIPIKLSQLTNDENFIKNTTNNLVNYYNTVSTYNRSEVNGLINTISSLSLQKVIVLPDNNISTSTIYLLLKTDSSNNIYEQYINLTGTVDGYEMIGTTEINLNNYYDKLENDILLDKKVDKTDFELIKEKIGDDKLNIGVNLSNAVNQLLKLINPNFIKRYGIKINLNDSNPDTRVEYLYDAVGMKPAFMNFNTGVFDYGDWKDIWFVKNNRPVMLNFDGTVAYELNHNDHNFKIDGTNSDIDNLNFNGNAMSEIPLIWIKRYNENNYDYIIFCEEKYDDTYTAYAHTNINGNILPVTYFPIFEGSIVSNKMRSISNQTVTVSTTDREEITASQQNGIGWNKLSYSECNLIYEMCIMISKSTDTQTKFGQGHSKAIEILNTGTMNTKGQFYGYNLTTNGIKLFYCENFFGNVWKRINGFLNINGKMYLKFIPPYNSIGTNYINTELTPSGTNGGYCNKMKITDGGRIPFVASGSNNTFECDHLWFQNSNISVACFGGSCDLDFGCGLSCWAIHDTETFLNNRFGSSISYKSNI